MSDATIERIMMLACCSEEDAKQAFSKTNDIIDAVDTLMLIPKSRGAPIQKIISKEQTAFMEIRKNMEVIEESVQLKLTKSNQYDSFFQALRHTHVLDQEEMMLRSDCIQNSQIPAQVEEEQK